MRARGHDDGPRRGDEGGLRAALVPSGPEGRSYVGVVPPACVALPDMFGQGPVIGVDDFGVDDGVEVGVDVGVEDAAAVEVLAVVSIWVVGEVVALAIVAPPRPTPNEPATIAAIAIGLRIFISCLRFVVGPGTEVPGGQGSRPAVASQLRGLWGPLRSRGAG